MSPDPKELPQPVIAGFIAGDVDAVQHVYEVFAGPVATVARSVVGSDQALIDEIVQLTFTKAWKAAAGFQHHRKFAPWIYTIARHTAIDVIRAEKNPTRGDHEPEVDVGVESASMEQTWETFEVRRAIQDLPSDEQKIVKLHYSIGMTHEQIAHQLNIPIGTVKSRSYRAHQRLRNLLHHVREQTPSPTTEGQRHV